MRKTIQGISLTLILLLLLLFLMIGCTPARRPNPEQIGSEQERERTDINERRMEDLETRDQDLRMGGLAPNEKPESENKETRNWKIERQIKEMIGIKDSIVILNENAAYIGLESEGDVDITQVRGMQGEVANQIHQIYPELETIYITSDMEKVSQLREYEERLGRGGQRQKLFEEIEGLF